MISSFPTVIVGQCPIFREGLRRILADAGFHTVWSGNAPPATPLEWVDEDASPLFVTISSTEDAVAGVSQFREQYPASKAIMISNEITEKTFVTAVRSEINVVVHDKPSFEGLIYAFRLVVSGVYVFPSQMLNTLVTHMAPKPIEFAGTTGTSIGMLSMPPRADSDFAKLSMRESDVLSQLVSGLSNKEIARQLHITEATVKVHVKAIFRKTGVRSRTQLALWASRQATYC